MKHQQGVTLAVTLILLFVITLLSLSSMQVTRLQEKMSSNLQDKELSFQAAESALRAGELWLLGLSQEPTVVASCSSYPCVREVFQNMNFTTQTPAWWAANSQAYSTSLTNITSSPRYLIEFMQFVPDSLEIGTSSQKSTGVFYYQITARGTGSTDNAVSILQTTVARRF